ncbi:PREDICTED: regucalcin-like [Amphimedon queenslandica]|uniref:Regucalcin n=1 Tax=Amphimedon queenslandica TaxID=400682 RepID=A0A1X7VCC6_AMPQE|nr:PREDICTED: regucalcin-like [Amphimedon queenslandica]|eukprot:XP_019849866.1 PREDICTED: regucalcin-like [Amphimedon queenslandica]
MAAGSYQVDVVLDAKAQIGEGPVYEEETNELLWVDIPGKTINFLNLKDFSNRRLQFTKTVGAVIPCKTGSNLIAVLGQSVCMVDRTTGDVKELCSVQREKETTRFNDSKCDKSGRLWCGTMAMETAPGVLEEKQGNLYSFDGIGGLHHHVSEVTISNGLEWSLDNTTMYYIDSIPCEVYSFKYDELTGQISDKKVIIDYSTDKALGLPDGMCRDSEGKLWIASYNGGCVTRWDPNTGERMMQIPLPARRITSCCFGGSDYSTLYVTSASSGASPEELSQYPLSGALFAIRGLPVNGLPSNKFDNSKINI